MIYLGPQNRTKEILELDRTVYALDIETLGLDLDAVVFDIGVVATNFLPKPGVRWSVKDVARLTALAHSSDPNNLVFSATRISLSITEQVLRGRTVNSDTVAFHTGVFSSRGSPSFINTMTEGSRTAVTLEEARAQLNALTIKYPPKEVWCNHTSFDIPRITSALYDGQPSKLPWTYRMEHDIFTYKEIYRASLSKTDKDFTKYDKTQDVHDSIGDCLYNLAVLSACRFGSDYEV